MSRWSVSEALTVAIINDCLKQNGFTEDRVNMYYESVKIDGEIMDDRIWNLQKSCSKSRSGLPGRIEFIIRPNERDDLLIIIEAKEKIVDHQNNGPNGELTDINERPVTDIKRYAIDGALHYAKHFSAGFNVIAIAVSGSNSDMLRVSSFIHRNGERFAEPLTWPNMARTPINALVNLDDYLLAVEYNPVQITEAICGVDEVVREIKNKMAAFGPEPARALTMSSIISALMTDGAWENIANATGFDEKRDALISTLESRYLNETLEDNNPIIQLREEEE